MPNVTSQEAERLVGPRSVLEQPSMESAISINVDGSGSECEDGGHSDRHAVAMSDAETASLHSDSTDGGRCRGRVDQLASY